MRSHRQLREALRYARVGYWTLDAQTQTAHWSAEIYRIFGLEPETPAGPETLRRLLQPADAEMVLGSLEHSCATGVEHNLDYRIRRPDGTQRWVTCRAKAVWDEAGKVSGLEGFLQDITERQEAAELQQAAEREARESAALFTTAFQAAGTMLTISSLDEGVYEHVNDAFVERTGYAREAAIGVRSVDLGFISEAQRQHLIEILQSDGRIRDLELRLTRQDGRSIDCLYNGEVIEVGGIRKLLSIAQDITPLKDSQRALQASEERFALAMRGSNDGVFDWDLETNRVYYSPRWKAMLGYADDELENTLDTWERLVAPDDRLASWRMLQDYMEGKRDDFTTEFRMRHKDGHWVEVLSRAYLARDADGKPARVVGTHVDITERKRSQRQIEAERARAEQYLRVAGSILLALDREGRITLINPKGCEVIGLAESELLGRDWITGFIPEAERDAVASILAHLLQDDGQASEYVEGHLLTAQGDERLIAWHNRVVRDAEGRPTGTLSSGEDVTEQRAAEQALQEERRFLQDIIDGIEDPILVVDRDRRIRRMNRSAQGKAADMGMLAGDLRCYQLIYQSDAPCHETLRSCPMTNVLRSGKPSKVMHQVLGADGREHTHEFAATPLRGRHGTIDGIIEISRDITDQIELLEALHAKDLRYAHLAQHDPLTELPNRFLFSDRLSQAVQLAQRSHAKLAVLFIDLDQFKQINDSFDHSHGDAVLVALARRLEGLIRGADTLARMGGDEFSIILSTIQHDEDAAKVAREVLALFQQPFEVHGHRLFLGASIGISLHPEHGDNGEDLIRNADAALFRAKAEGRNNFQYYSQDLTAKAFERILLESSLHDAIANQELVLYYQPQLHLPSGKPCGVEALLRWRHPSMGLIAPDRFIPLAESTGLIVPIGEWVLREACAQMRHWLRSEQLPADATMAVNLSTRQLAHDDLVDRVQQALASAGLAAVNLELEITESSLMASPDESAMRLRQLRDLGVKLGMDDFGTGYSSLSYLKQLPLTKLKIDRSFVSDIPEDANDAAITQAIIGLGKSLALEILAEGIETEVQRDFLLDEGCEQGQGYLFAKPLPVSELERFLAALAARP
ncbi:EAL and GGDEF domain-containing protein [Halochromatium glycolicum]|nr:EAL domain-containing protein [Halochromatium glycolicum]